MKGLVWCKEHIRLLLVDLACLLVFVILSICSNQITKTQYSQQEAQRWSANGIPYHQVSAFIRDDSHIGADTISQVRSQLQAKLMEASYTQESATGRLWIDAYMAQTQASVSKESEIGTAMVDNVNICGVGGDFFAFHPLDMIAGNVFRDDDYMQDHVVIDLKTAWELYGATDIVGKRISIGGNDFVISGVYRPDDGKYDKLAMGTASYIFMDYDAMVSMNADSVPGIICYEAALPQPVKGFALAALKEAFGEDEETLGQSDTCSFSDKDYVDNTQRFQAGPLLRKLWYLPTLMMRTSGVSYPYWENIVRAIEFKVAILQLFRLLFIAVPIVTIVIFVIGFIKREHRNLKCWIKSRFSDMIEKMNAKSRQRMQKKQQKEQD